MSDTENAVCPACGNSLRRCEMEKLSAMLFGVRPIKCSQCETTLRWSEKARQRLTKIYNFWLIGAAMVIWGVLSHFGVALSMPNYSMLIMLVGVAINLSCIGWVRHFANNNRKKLEVAGHPSRLK